VLSCGLLPNGTWKRFAEFCKHRVLRSGDNCDSWRERGRLLIAFVKWTGPAPSSVTCGGSPFPEY
jgi:hypothetical protein